jgi:hypothetical protein
MKQCIACNGGRGNGFCFRHIIGFELRELAASGYVLVMKAHHFPLINWYTRTLARLGYTATWQQDRGWIVYPIPKM